MPVVEAIIGIAQGLVKPITGHLNKRVERKQNKDSIKGKAAAQKQDDATQVTLTDAEWETVNQSIQDKTWKDEYVTVSLVSIFNLYIVGGIGAAFGYPEVLDGTTRGIEALVAAGVDLGFLLTAVVLAAIGMKMWRM